MTQGFPSLGPSCPDVHLTVLGGYRLRNHNSKRRVVQGWVSVETGLRDVHHVYYEMRRPFRHFSIGWLPSWGILMFFRESTLRYDFPHFPHVTNCHRSPFLGSPTTASANNPCCATRSTSSAAYMSSSSVDNRKIQFRVVRRNACLPMTTTSVTVPRSATASYVAGLSPSPRSSVE